MKKATQTKFIKGLTALLGFSCLSITTDGSSILAAQENSIPLNLTIVSTPINVTLPSSIDLSFNGTNVNATVADNFRITNNGKMGNIKVTNVAAKIKDSTWSLNSDPSDKTYENLPLDSKQLYVEFSSGSTSTALTPSGIDPNIKIGPDGSGTNVQAFSLTAKTGGSSATIDSTLIDLQMTLELEKAAVEIPIDYALDDSYGMYYSHHYYSNEAKTTFAWEMSSLGPAISSQKQAKGNMGGNMGSEYNDIMMRSTLTIQFTLPTDGVVSFTSQNYSDKLQQTFKVTFGPDAENNKWSLYNKTTGEYVDSKLTDGAHEFNLKAGTYEIKNHVESWINDSQYNPSSFEDTIYLKDLKITADHEPLKITSVHVEPSFICSPIITINVSDPDFTSEYGLNLKGSSSITWQTTNEFTLYANNAIGTHSVYAKDQNGNIVESSVYVSPKDVGVCPA